MTSNPIDKSIYIFHRSLRLYDNIGLIECLKNSSSVIPVFIFTPEQITRNKYKSLRAIEFMKGSLNDLNKELIKYKSKLYIFYGKQDKTICKLLKEDKSITGVYFNKEYTKYGTDREKSIKKVCMDNKVGCVSVSDYLLHVENKISNSTGKYYSKFTPYYNKISKFSPPSPINNKYNNYISSSYKFKLPCYDFKFTIINNFIPTRKEALRRLKNVTKHKKYNDNRNNLSLETTQLSPYIKFGLLSIREVYHYIKKIFGRSHDLIRQLYWREFYFTIAINNPNIFIGKSMKPLYDNIIWNKTSFSKWKKGNTGFPIVDAGMRELNNTGYMHNRSRLITSNFLIKVLGIDWRLGEKYYATKLIDYDPSINNGNWQWSSGSGADSQPYFRIFNPWLQSKKNDKDCIYIKKWVPELIGVEPKDIHKWYDYHNKYNINYPKPCVDYNKKAKETIKRYKKIYNKKI